MSTEFINDQWRLPNAWNGSESNVNKQSNYSMDFDGTSGVYITAGDNNSLSGPFSGYTISAWVKTPTSFNTNYNAVFTKKYSFYFGFHPDNSFINYGSSGTAYGTEHKSTYTFSLDTWYYLTATADGTNIKMYVNGVLNDTFADTNTAQNSNTSNTPYLGGFNNSGDYDTYKGKLDAICIFDYPLSSSQITTLYGSSSTGIGNPMSLSPKPVAYYPLGDQDAFNGANYLVPNSSLKDYVFDFIPNDYIDTSTLSVTGDWSVSLWVNTDSTSYQTATQLSSSASTGTQDAIIFVRNTYISNTWGFYDGASTLIGSVLNTGQWYHLALTKSGTTYTLYLNGSQENQASKANINITDLLIGRRSYSAFYYDGKISNFQVFNSALPATGSNSVETLYNNGSPLTLMSGYTSLQGWWKLDASATYDSSTNTWSIPDDSTNSNDGTSSGMTQANLVQSDLSFTSGYSPYALDFDGVDDYISLSTDIFDFGSNAFSFSGWVKRTSIGDSTNVILFIQKSGTTPTMQIRQNARNIKVDFNVGSTWSFVETTTNPIGNDTNWHHLLVTKSGTSMSIYFDGVLQDTGTAPATLDAGNDSVFIGSRAASSQFWNGSISNLSIWNAALTSAQVTEIYNEGVPSNLNNHSAYSNLVSWWQLGSNSSFNTNWTVLDEKGSNNGTSQNMDEVDIVDGVGSYGGGTSSGMGGDEVIGSAPFSDANSLSINMDVLDRTEDTPS